MEFLHKPAIVGGFVAFITAVGVDLHAWKSWGDVAFQWKTASYRWFVAVFAGATAGAGLGSL